MRHKLHEVFQRYSHIFRMGTTAEYELRTSKSKTKEAEIQLTNYGQNNVDDSLSKTDVDSTNEGCLQPKKFLLLAVLSITEFVTFASITVLSPFFPKEAEKKNASPTAYGAVIGIFELAALLISYFSIKAVTLIYPRTLILCGIVALGIGTLLFSLIYLIPSGWMYVTTGIALRIVQGFGAGVVDVCGYMVVTTEMPEKVSTAIGVLEMAVGLGMTVGPALGGALYDVGGFIMPFLFVGSLTLIMAPLNFIVFPVKAEQSTDKPQKFFRFLLDAEVIISIISIVCGGAVLGFLTGVLEPHLRQFELSSTMVGVITLTTGGVFAMTTPIWGHVCDKKVNPYYLILAGCVLNAVGFLFLGPFPLFPFETILWLLILSLVLCGLGSAAQSVCPYVVMLRSAKRLGLAENVTTSALVSAIHITASNAGSFFGPFIGGMFQQYLGFRNGTALMIPFQAIQIVITVIVWRKYRSGYS